jgi:hypothetical protein
MLLNIDPNNILLNIFELREESLKLFDDPSSSYFGTTFHLSNLVNGCLGLIVNEVIFLLLYSFHELNPPLK